ncbi:hypothetical protein [Methylobacterium sp. V23]|uniref:hypothetical protein n=1 Tax=Methylobacterium sp. V23 TaxID=2044878 RepID=UPI000CDAECAF|nr:hypothetical protein [Methylobacterium sp. V23]POR40311.1 hypothetical protein CRT23_24640 [Methylobacterium sp. V23]
MRHQKTEKLDVDRPRSKAAYAGCKPFQEAPAHLGVETQRQWSDKAIARTTPCLLALFGTVTLLASQLPIRGRARATKAAWYAKTKPTFVDALAAVRYALWREQTSVMSRRQRHRPKRRFVLPPPLAYVLCQSACSAKVGLTTGDHSIVLTRGVRLTNLPEWLHYR